MRHTICSPIHEQNENAFIINSARINAAEIMLLLHATTACQVQ